MVIDHLHGRHAMPENIGPVRRLWMMTLLGDPPRALSRWCPFIGLASSAAAAVQYRG